MPPKKPPKKTPPAKRAPSKKAPAKAPAKKVPAKRALAKRAPAKTTHARKPSAKKRGAKRTRKEQGGDNSSDDDRWGCESVMSDDDDDELQPPNFCVICATAFPTKAALNQHFQSKQHEKQLELTFDGRNALRKHERPQTTIAGERLPSFAQNCQEAVLDFAQAWLVRGVKLPIDTNLVEALTEHMKKEASRKAKSSKAGSGVSVNESASLRFYELFQEDIEYRNWAIGTMILIHLNKAPSRIPPGRPICPLPLECFRALAFRLRNDWGWASINFWHDHPLPSLLARATQEFCTMGQFVHGVEGVNLAKKKFFVNKQPVGTLLHPDVEALLAQATVAGFGKGGDLVVDGTVRSAFEIPASAVSFDSPTHQPPKRAKPWHAIHDDVGDDFIRRALETLAPGHSRFEVEAELYKIHIYRKGGHFQLHSDTQYSPEHFATGLVIVGGAEHEGGTLVVRHFGRDVRVSSQGPETLTLATFFTDCQHLVEPVTAGTRVVLQYMLKTREGMVSGSKKTADKKKDTSKKAAKNDDDATAGRSEDMIKLLAEVRAWTDKRKGKTDSGPLLLTTHHRYAPASLDAQFLKGSDRALWDALAEEGYGLEIVAVGQRLQERHHKKKEAEGQFYFACMRGPVGTIVGEPRGSVNSWSSAEYTGNDPASSDYLYTAAAIVVRAEPKWVPSAEVAIGAATGSGRMTTVNFHVLRHIFAYVGIKRMMQQRVYSVCCSWSRSLSPGDALQLRNPFALYKRLRCRRKDRFMPQSSSEDDDISEAGELPVSLFRSSGYETKAKLKKTRHDGSVNVNNDRDANDNDRVSADSGADDDVFSSSASSNGKRSDDTDVTDTAAPPPVRVTADDLTKDFWRMCDIAEIEENNKTSNNDDNDPPSGPCQHLCDAYLQKGLHALWSKITGFFPTSPGLTIVVGVPLRYYVPMGVIRSPSDDPAKWRLYCDSDRQMAHFFCSKGSADAKWKIEVSIGCVLFEARGWNGEKSELEVIIGANPGSSEQVVLLGQSKSALYPGGLPVNDEMPSRFQASCASRAVLFSFLMVSAKLR